MKIKSLLLLLFFSLTAQAKAGDAFRPGDDIWNNIKELYAGVAAANRNIEQVGNLVHSLQEYTQNLQTQINNVPEGKKGERGEKGDRGIQGEKGTQGERGAQGERGLQGELGLQGTTGLQGERGLQGEKGQKGEAGAQGAQGLPGNYTAGEGITIEGSVIKAIHTTHKIGELYHGGIIFWLDETSEHGLIVSKLDINKGQGIQWRNGASGNKVTNARADGIGAGENNTNIIIAQQTIDQQTGNFAALIAVKYRVQEDGETPCPSPDLLSATCYGAWYLPSAHELALIRNNLSQQGLVHFAPDYYWSSTEANATTAWMQNFATGELIANKKDSTLGQVRAVSRF